MVVSNKNYLKESRPYFMNVSNKEDRKEFQLNKTDVSIKDDLK